MGESGSGIAGNQLVTQIIRLQHENANNLVAVLRPLISPNNTININPGNNSLVITDYADNLRRMARIVAALDIPNATDVEVIPLQHAVASDLLPILQRLLDGSGAAAGGQGDASFKTTVVQEPRSNAVIVRTANQARMNMVKSLIQKLDQPSAGSNGEAGNIYVVYLKNANATKLATTLRAALSGGAPAAAPAAASPGQAPGTAGATGGQIQADAATNSLIITASEPQYRQLRAVIDKLDARRAQVFVESVIAEVSADKAAEFGIQWQGTLGQKGDSVIGLLGTNFGTGGRNIIGLSTPTTTGLTPPAGGLNFGTANQIGGVYVLGFLARFLESSGSGNVLSTPNLLTLDNEEAEINIGQNVPFVGQITQPSSPNASPFQGVERKDVGIKLKFKPQISEDGTINLNIYQEVSSVANINPTLGPTTNKRSISTNVVVNDGSIVVLGGLLQDDFTGNQEKVPGLGDVPVLGNLFKSEARSRKKTNLMVFLRPVVVRDAASTERVSIDRYDYMRNLQIGAQPKPSSVMPINETAIMQPLSLQPTATLPASPKAP
jgi:general secretion pathway protein D